MTPAHTRATVRLVQDGLRAWVEALVQAADDPKQSPAPTVGLFPLRTSAAGRSGDTQGLPMLAPPDLGRDAPTGLPPAWADLTRPMAAALEKVFPRPERPGPASRPRPAPAIDQLPPALSAWYKARRAESDAWLWRLDGVDLARAPSLTWRSSVQLRLAYLVAVEGAAEDTLPLLSAVCTAMVHENSYTVRLPPVAMDPSFASFVQALDTTTDADLLTPLARVTEPEELVVSITPSSDLTPPQLAQVTASMGRPGLPHLQVALGVGVNGGAVFAPAAVPTFAGRPRRGETE